MKSPLVIVSLGLLPLLASLVSLVQGDEHTHMVRLLMMLGSIRDD